MHAQAFVANLAYVKNTSFNEAYGVANVAANVAAEPSGRPHARALPRRSVLQRMAVAAGAVWAAAAQPGKAQTVEAAPARPTRASVLAAATKLEKTKISIAVNNKTLLCYLPLTLAEQLGYFADEGLDVEITETPSLARALQALGSGSADVVSGWYENVLTQHAQTDPMRAFVLLGRTPQMALGVSTKTLSAGTRLGDLRGKKIGITAPGTPSHTVALAMLARAGLGVQDVGLVSVGTGAGAGAVNAVGGAAGPLAALRAGQVDALCAMDTALMQLEQKGELRIVADARSLRGTRDLFGGDMSAACLFAPQEFLQKNPNTAQAVAHAVVHALKWLQTAGISDLMKTVPEGYFAYDRALYLATFNRMREGIALDGLMSADSVKNTWAALRRVDSALAREKIDLASTYTNVFAQRAKQRFKA